MDEDIAIIDSNTRKEKVKNFFLKNKIILISLISFIILSLVIYFGYAEYSKKKKIEISDFYNSTTMYYSDQNKEDTVSKLIKIINEKDPTYSPLSLYFIIDNNLVSDRSKINELFDILIKEISLDKEIKNLIIYKKALFNADEIDENSLLDMLNPLINSESIWKSHALYILAEYFYEKNEKQKSKEFFNNIINTKNANQNILKEAQKRLSRDLSD
tara:strand:- start:307 stop:951 length:645 start_codon:yes stop_codon:yes gene_type:complete